MSEVLVADESGDDTKLLNEALVIRGVTFLELLTHSDRAIEV